ncbi:MAG: Fic family protein [Nanoarchaeota archaeon]|nr:Fic family protein [Nanoarchaeota archaeon]
MVSEYDVFYVVASKGGLKVADIVKTLQKPKSEYQNIFNNVLKLEKKGYIKRDNAVKVMYTEKAKSLFRLISFCTNNGINYNLMFKKIVLEFVYKASMKEFFTIKDIRVHPQTFSYYVNALAKYGFLLVVTKKPMKCKLLRHHFLVDLMSFFGKKLEFYTPKQKTFIDEIKKELKKYRNNLKINYTIIEEFENKEEVNFIYSSLTLEGNPLTLPETQKLIQDNIVPGKHKLVHIQEVTNYRKAVDLMIANAKRKIRLNQQLILEYHRVAMSHIRGAGEIRKQNVRIKLNPNFKTCNWHLIPLKLKELIEEYKKFEVNKKDIKAIIGFASFFHNEFQRIHPFIDGNSRISRLLMLHILRSHGIPMLDLPLGYFDLYLDLTKRSAKRDDKAFKYLIEEIIVMNLKKINSTI